MPAKVKSVLIDVRREVDEVPERSSCLQKCPPREKYARCGKLERDVLLLAVGEEVAEKNLRVDLDPPGAAPRCRNQPESGVGRPLRVLPCAKTSRPPLVAPDGGGELECELGVIASGVDRKTELSDELGLVGEELRQIVLPARGQGVQPEKLA